MKNNKMENKKNKKSTTYNRPTNEQKKDNKMKKKKKYVPMWARSRTTCIHHKTYAWIRVRTYTHDSHIQFWCVRTHVGEAIHALHAAAW